MSLFTTSLRVPTNTEVGVVFNNVCPPPPPPTPPGIFNAAAVTDTGAGFCTAAVALEPGACDKGGFGRVEGGIPGLTLLSTVLCTILLNSSLTDVGLFWLPSSALSVKGSLIPMLKFKGLLVLPPPDVAAFSRSLSQVVVVVLGEGSRG